MKRIFIIACLWLEAYYAIRRIPKDGHNYLHLEYYLLECQRCGKTHQL